jgi:hypothetical protein
MIVGSGLRPNCVLSDSHNLDHHPGSNTLISSVNPDTITAKPDPLHLISLDHTLQQHLFRNPVVRQTGFKGCLYLPVYCTQAVQW